jgi:mitochondrial import inner membrane translocase subunit TIM17
MREDTNREPCPWRIVDDAGGAFVFGVAGGTIWHAIGGARNAAKGHMMSQALSRVKTRVPILGGSFAVWGTLFSCFDCSFTYLRKKEDPWNAIISGAATGGLLAARAGPKVAAKNAAFGGIILAAIEGLNVMISRVVVPYFERKSNESSGMISAVDRLEPPVDPLRRRSGRVAHVPIDFGPPSADTSGFGSIGSLPDVTQDFAQETWSADKKQESAEKKGWW